MLRELNENEMMMVSGGVESIADVRRREADEAAREYLLDLGLTHGEASRVLNGTYTSSTATSGGYSFNGTVYSSREAAEVARTIFGNLQEQFGSSNSIPSIITLGIGPNGSGNQLTGPQISIGGASVVFGPTSSGGTQSGSNVTGGGVNVSTTF